MSDSVDALLGGEEDVGDYDIKDDEEDALLEDDDDGSRNNEETKDVLELSIDDALNEDDDTELSDSEGRSKFLNERQTESNNTPRSYNYHNNYNKQYKYINNNVTNNRGRGMRGHFRGFSRGNHSIGRHKTFTPRFEPPPNKLFINPHFKGHTHINYNSQWEQKPKSLPHVWHNKHQSQPSNDYQAQPIMPVNNFQSQPQVQHQHQMMHKPPVHQRLGINNSSYSPQQVNSNYEQERFMGVNQMQQPPPVVSPINNQYNMPPTYNQPPPMYQPPVNNMSYNLNQYQQPPQNVYQQYAPPPQPLIHQNTPPPIFNQPPPQIYQNDSHTFNTFAPPPPQIQQYNANDNNYNQNYHNNYQQQQHHVPTQQQQHHQQQHQKQQHQPRYQQADAVITPVINRQVFYNNQQNFGKRRNDRRPEVVDDYCVNKRRSYENKVLHQVQTVETTPSNNTTISTTQYQASATPEVVEDEETKKYREKIEEQKKLRELLLAQKEERRKIAAKKKQAEEEYETVVSPKEILMKAVQPAIIPVQPQRKLAENPANQQMVHANPNLKVINATEGGNENKVDKGQLKSFLSNRTIFAKDQSLVDTSLVVVSNLAAGTSEVKLRKMCEGLGDIQKIDLSPKERQVTIHFKSVASAHAFYKKYQRFMLDLSVIQVALKAVG
ncbi:PREDICTED: transcription factor mef2A-like [Nicrophorus vespilloides]|uniref:Transcription factor mef2A-like n=1 Tax=Nicrophorus vespilloides TaxID=110193 RepID=A0ABM1MT39_NICVS|nr:PREDICTED: transcription factor mef2A-like [Nicrophorus vespilloides]